MDNRSKGSVASLQRWADRQAAACHLDLLSNDWGEERATGRVASPGWEIIVEVRSAKVADGSSADPEADQLGSMQARVLRVLGDKPMRTSAIAAAIGAEDGRYLRRAVRALYNAGKVTQHVKGWVRFA